MNAITREALVESTFTRGISFSFNLPEFKVLILLFIALASALSVVYIKDLNRRLFIDYRKLELRSDQLQAENNKLLLEHSALGSQARIQAIAQESLKMRIPTSAEVIMIKV
ncbi:MAG: cell division protein FtsL [Coxiellaceae bacterium]|jgi:cell division protein FtsL|nr:cell division protein FtsL [Coxiellaceae bacterium]